jgi:hypothetical protein
MRFWVPAAVGGLIIVAYAYLYTITITESQGATALGVANTVGLLGVFVALVAVGFILRRATPKQ